MLNFVQQPSELKYLAKTPRFFLRQIIILPRKTFPAMQRSWYYVIVLLRYKELHSHATWEKRNAKL